MSAASSAPLAPPTNRLGNAPQLESVADIDRALHELAFLDAVNATLDAESKAAIAAAKERCEQRKVVEVDGDAPVTLADRKAALENAVLDFCDKHYAAVLDGCKGKTRKLTHGEVKWKNSPAGLGFVDDASEADDVVACCDKAAPHKGGVAGAVLRCLQRIKVTERLTAASLCKVEVKFDRTAVWKAYQAGAIDDDDLAAVLLAAREREEYVSLKPYDYQSEQPSGAAVAGTRSR